MALLKDQTKEESGLHKGCLLLEAHTPKATKLENSISPPETQWKFM